MFKPEILAPGGSFNSSIHAFEAGADAIYAGMSSFSARKGAENFTLDRLRRLKTYASEQNKKIYIAINTVLLQDELKDIILLLHHLSDIEVDGIILQDMGLARILKEFFPHLERHASTQLAVHNSMGVEVLKEQGFSRIILARELSLEEIKSIREEHKDVELEVFIHGAMCYSVSGLCLASGKLLGRSGNRGECGQICRTWFDGKEKHQFAFSANDMKAGEYASKLQEIGIDSLKIEGRLKSPAYVSHTVAYYDSLLKGKHNKEEELKSSISFSRNQTTAFFQNPKGKDMINNQFASHTGIPAGSIISSQKGRYNFRAEQNISDRDGLLVFIKGKAHQFALKSTSSKNHYKKGDIIEFAYSENIAKGAKISLVSRHDMQMKEHKEESYKPWKSKIDLKIQVEQKQIIIGDFHFPIELEASQKPKHLDEIFHQIFSKSGLSNWMMKSLVVENKSNFPSDGIYINPKLLKNLRQSYFQFLEQSLYQSYEKSANEIIDKINKKLSVYERVQWQGDKPRRKEMSTFGVSQTPFYPLPPLQFHKMDFEKLEKGIDEFLNQNDSIVLGLNNISHLYFVEKYKNNQRVFFFTDYSTYVANKATALFYREKIERLVFSYYWIEDPTGSLEGLRKVEDDFKPHLFVSRICYKLHNGLEGCKNCKKDYVYDLKQRDRQFEVHVKDCLTWLYEKG